MISKDDVAHLATLARIKVADDECASLATEMEAILGYVEDVRELAGDGAQPEHHLVNVMRNDEVTNKPGEYTERIVSQFPEQEGNALKVKKILSQ